MKKLFSLGLLSIFFITSTPTTSAMIGQKIVDKIEDHILIASLENPSQPEEDPIESQEEPDLGFDYNDLDYQIKDPYVDEYIHPDGMVSMKLYSSARNLVFNHETETYSELPEGFSYFKYYNQEKETFGNGYQYFIGNGKEMRHNEFTIRSGDMIFRNGSVKQQSLPTEKEDTTEGVKYSEVYPGVDVEFKDGAFSREKFIIIKEKPQYLGSNDELVFNDIIELPDNATIIIGNENEVTESGEYDLEFNSFSITLEDGTILKHGNSIIYDTKTQGLDAIDKQAVGVKQKLIYNNEFPDEVIVQQIIPSSYLNSPERQYPVTIDPALHYCKESVVYKDGSQISSNCSIEDFYSRSPEGNTYDSTELYMGRVGSTYRLPVIQFNNITNYVPQGSTINGAWLNAFYNTSGSGSFDRNTKINFAAGIIGTNLSNKSLDYLLANSSLNGGVTGVNYNPGNEYTWYIKNFVSQWVSNPSTNHGLLLSESKSKNTWKDRIHRLYSSTASNPAMRPFLSVSYTPPAAPNPDIEIVKIEQVTPKLLLNNPFEVKVTIKKTGTLNSSHTVRVNLGQDPNSSYGAKETIVVSPNGPTTEVLTFTLNPSWVYVPMDYIRAEVDYYDDIVESDETNNSKSQRITSPPTKPDLFVSSMSVDDYLVHAGGRTRVRVTIKNQGGQSNATDVDYLINSTNSLTGARLLNYDNFGSLNTGDTANEDSSIYIPNDLSAGTHYIIANIDPDNKVDEDDESNNARSYRIEVKPDVPQVRIDSFAIVDNIIEPAIDNPFDEGDIIQVDIYGIENTSTTSDAVNMTYNLILVEQSTGIEYGLTDITPTTIDVAAGGRVNVSATGKVPKVDSGGKYRIRVIIDHANHYDEVIETDNSYDGQIDFYIKEPYKPSYHVAGGNPSNPGTTFTSPQDVESGAIAQDPVNFRNGQFYLISTDFILEGRGHDIDFARTYNSRNAHLNSRFGNGWSHAYNAYLHENEDGTINLFKGGSIASTLTSSDGVKYYAQGSQDVLVKVANGYEYQSFHGDKFYFIDSTKIEDGLYMISSTEDQNGNKTTFQYLDRNGIKLINQIQDASGRILEITYGDEDDSTMWDKITKIQTNIPGEHTLQVDYEYTIQGDLTLLTKSTEHRTYSNESTEFIVKQYEYDNNGFLTTYTDPRGTKVINEYDQDGRTIKQFYYDPSIHTNGQSYIVYDYTYEQTLASVPNATCTVSNSYATDTEIQILTMCFDADGQKVAEIKGSNSIARYEYNSNGLITKFTDPNGNSTHTTYNEKLQITSITYPEVGGRTLVKTYTYNDQNKPLTITETETDSNNNQTVRTFTNEYDQYGNLTKEINPLGDSSTYEYDQYGNLTKTTDSKGNITKFFYTSDHNYISNSQQPYTTIDGRNKSSNNTYEYDNFGNITKHYNPRAYPKTMKYDSHGNLRETVSRIGATTTYRYDLEHNLIQEINHLGHVVEYEYQTDLHENLATVTKKATVSSTDSVMTTKQFNRLGQVTKIIDPNGNSTTFTYNDRGLAVQSQTPTKTINYTYDANGNLTSEQIQGGAKVEYFYDNLNRQYKTRRYKTNTNYQETSIIQDSYGNPLESIAANGAKTTFTYDLNHRLTSETNDLQQTTNYAYDQNGNLVGITLPRSLSDTSLVNDDGYSISYHYNQLNQKIKEIDRDNNVTVYEYDDAGNLITTIQNTDLQLSQNEQTTNYHYNALNLNDQITYADGTKTTLYYDAIGRLYAQVNPEGERDFINIYDHLGRVTKVMNDNGYYLAQNQYDKNSNLIKQTLPNNQVITKTYDAENRLVSMTDGEGNTTTYEYNANDFNTKINKPNNKFQSFQYDLLGNITQETNSQNIHTIYSYNDLNQLTQTNYGSTVTKFEYDTIGQLVSQTDPTKDTTSTEKYTFQYDEEGNLTQVVDPINGEQDPLVFTYDKLNRLTSKKSSDIDQTFQYDRHSRLTSSANPDFELQYTYNNINQITQEDHIFKQAGTPITRTIKRDYNTDGTLKTLTYPSTHQVQYEYTNTNQLSTVKIGSTHLATYNYTNDQILTNTTYSNGVSTNYVYDKNNQVKEINTSSTISKFLPRSQTYTYDENLNTSQINNNGVLTTNQFDVLDQLKSSQIGDNTYTYNYNQYGDRTASTITTPTSTQTNSYTYDPKTQQLVTLTETTGQDSVTTDFSYDKIGNLTTEVETNSTNEITKNYQLNRLGYLEQIQQITKNLSTNNTTETNSTYTYDNNGNRVSKTTDTETTYYLNDGLNVLAELRADGTRKMQRIYGLGAIAELSRYGTLYFLNEDRQQTLTLSTSRDGELGQELSYGPFGELADANQQTPSNSLVHKTDYQYTGQEYDPESGLQYYNARYYNAKLGRFIQRDTYLGQFGNSLTRNRYTYVNNNPYKYVDPTGNEPVTVAVIETVVDLCMTIYDGAALAYYTYQEYAHRSSYSGKSCSVSDAALHTEHAYYSDMKNQKAVDLSLSSSALLLPYVNSVYLKGGAAAVRYGDEIVEITGDVARNVDNVYTNPNIADDFFEGAIYTDKVTLEKQLKSDVLHNFPNSVEGFAGSYGSYFSKVGGDGNWYTHLEVAGGYRNKDGVFEFIKDQNGNINHSKLNSFR